MTKLSYIQAGEAVSGDDISGDGNANQVVRSLLTLSGLNPDADFPGFLTQIGVQNNATPVGSQVNTLNFRTNFQVSGSGSTVDIDSTAIPTITTLPATVVPIAQYYTADAGIGVSDGSPVPTWHDQSGNGLDITDGDTGATAPTFHSNIDGDGLPCVSFDGVNNQLSRLAMTANNSTALTMFCVSRSAHKTSNSTLYSICGSGGDNSGDGAITVTTKEPVGLQMRFNYNSTFGVFSASVPAANTAASITDGIGEWTISIYRLRTIFGGGYVSVRQNFLSAAYALGVALTTNTYTHVYLGSGSTSGVGWPTNSKCDIRSFGIYKGLLQDYEVRNLLRFLGTKWNIIGFI